ncbi:Histidine protein kinase 1 [Sphaceloma murrayae]|uniref:Histidine protein kinase 1 n=1 Tax=Sphaceloma murrayae TaxID=2082308 RepID=A0A2K1QH41_9PEZI|nr:Histidine protein kinase 1 [Sphaceloma murrayae]
MKTSKPKSFFYLIDKASRLHVIEFSGPSISARPGTAWEEVRHFKPREEGEPSSRKMDIFGVGSTLYETATGSLPFSDLSGSDVQVRCQQDIFPGTDGILYGGTIW